MERIEKENYIRKQRMRQPATVQIPPELQYNTSDWIEKHSPAQYFPSARFKGDRNPLNATYIYCLYVDNCLNCSET